jgi:hypothetical protein
MKRREPQAHQEAAEMIPWQLAFFGAAWLMIVGSIASIAETLLATG